MRTRLKTLAIVLLIIAGGVVAQTTLVDGKDTTGTRRTIAVDTSRNQVVVGAGTAGSASGGVVTVQGVAGATAVPVSGTVVHHPGYLAAGAPTFGGVADNVTTGGTAFCSLTSGATYRICCSAAVTWRIGPATPTPLTTDNPLYGPVCEDIALGATDTCIAMITSSGTATCSGLIRRATP